MSDKVILWMLSLVGLLATAIGGSAANHLVTQLDSLSGQVSSLSGQVSSLEQTRNETERRLVRIEDKVDTLSYEQKIIKSALK